MNKEKLTDLLDVLAVLLIAAGFAAYVFPFVGWACLVLAGGIILLCSFLAAKNSKGREDE